MDLNNLTKNEIIDQITDLTFLCDEFDPFNFNYEVLDENTLIINEILTKNQLDHIAKNPFQVTSAILRKLDLLKEKLEQMELGTDLKNIQKNISSLDENSSLNNH
jgi:hypothetical protein